MTNVWPFSSLQRGVYRAILADPPWHFRARTALEKSNWTSRRDGELAGERGAHAGENPYAAGSAEAVIWEVARDYAVGDRAQTPAWRRRPRTAGEAA